jgi:hypothetical protein
LGEAFIVDQDPLVENWRIFPFIVDTTRLIREASGVFMAMTLA